MCALLAQPHALLPDDLPALAQVLAAIHFLPSPLPDREWRQQPLYPVD